MNKRAFQNMNTFTVLSRYSAEELQGILNESKTWVEFKSKCGMPKSRRQDGIRAYLDEHGLDYSNLPVAGEGMKKKSKLSTISDDTFREHVATAGDWTELLELCGYDNFGNIGAVRKRIREMSIDCPHLQMKKEKPQRKKITKAVIRRDLIAAATANDTQVACGRCGNAEWQGQPIKLKVYAPTKQDPSTASLLCPNCLAATKQENKQQGRRGARRTN